MYIKITFNEQTAQYHVHHGDELTDRLYKAFADNRGKKDIAEMQEAYNAIYNAPAYTEPTLIQSRERKNQMVYSLLGLYGRKPEPSLST